MKNPLTKPAEQAFDLADKMRKFRAATELNCEGVLADEQRSEVVRQIDWGKFNDLINQLEFVRVYGY